MGMDSPFLNLFVVLKRECSFAFQHSGKPNHFSQSFLLIVSISGIFTEDSVVGAWAGRQRSFHVLYSIRFFEMFQHIANFLFAFSTPLSGPPAWLEKTKETQNFVQLLSTLSWKLLSRSFLSSLQY